MKKISLNVVVGAFAALAITASAQTLEEGFKFPPNSAQPQTWCHLMNGNVTKDGITRDFEEIAKVGLGGVQIFDAGRACSAFYAALTGIPEATCRASCATSRLACFCL